MTNPFPRDSWTTGSSYEHFMGRWSRLIAIAFLNWLSPRPDLHWFELGCGTGALSEIILSHVSPSSVLAVDPSPEFIAFARHKVSDPRITFRVGNALDLPAIPQLMHVVASGLVLNFVSEPLATLQATHRLLRPDGILAFYVWDYSGRMEMLRYFWNAAVALNPEARSLDEGIRFPICRPDSLIKLSKEASFQNIEVTGIEVTMTFRDFDDYWSPFLEGQGPAPSYVASLDDTSRKSLESHLRATLPFREDGSLNLIARAWAVRATA